MLNMPRKVRASLRDAIECGETQTIPVMVDTCPLTRIEGLLQTLHEPEITTHKNNKIAQLKHTKVFKALVTATGYLAL